MSLKKPHWFQQEGLVIQLCLADGCDEKVRERNLGVYAWARNTQECPDLVLLTPRAHFRWKGKPCCPCSAVCRCAAEEVPPPFAFLKLKSSQ